MEVLYSVDHGIRVPSIWKSPRWKIHSGEEEMADRPADIISPTTNQVLPTKVPPADAREAGRFGYDKPTPDNSVMLFILIGCSSYWA